MKTVANTLKIAAVLVLSAPFLAVAALGGTPDGGALVGHPQTCREFTDGLDARGAVNMGDWRGEASSYLYVYLRDTQAVSVAHIDEGLTVVGELACRAPLGPQLVRWAWPVPFPVDPADQAEQDRATVREIARPPLEGVRPPRDLVPVKAKR